MGSLRPACRPGKLRTREYSLSLELTTNEPYFSDTDRMSYYRYITGLYKSYWPELNRTLRSSSVPRTLPETDPGGSKRYMDNEDRGGDEGEGRGGRGGGGGGGGGMEGGAEQVFKWCYGRQFREAKVY